MLFAALALTTSELKPAMLENPAETFDPLSYPVAAIKAKAQGTVIVDLTVSPKGRLTQCTVRRSVRTDLDQTSCRLIAQNGRFSAARDEKGEPVDGSFTLAVYWVLPGIGVSAPPKVEAYGLDLSLAGAAAAAVPSFVEVALFVDQSGAIRGCSTRGKLAPRVARVICQQASTLLKPSPLSLPGKPPVPYVRAETIKITQAVGG